MNAIVQRVKREKDSPPQSAGDKQDVPMPSFTDARLDRTAAAWEAEYECWIFRRRMDKSGYEAVRLDDPAYIVEDGMEITQLGASEVIANPAFNSMRRRACAKAALNAGRNARS